jgi:hypothetical protein
MPAVNEHKPPHKAAAVEAETQGLLLLNEERAAEMPTVPVPLPRSEAAEEEAPMWTVQEPPPHSAAR